MEPRTVVPVERNRRTSTADDKTEIGRRDRRRVAGEQPYEVGFFADKHHGISLAKARELIAKHRHDREALDRAASKVA